MKKKSEFYRTSSSSSSDAAAGTTTRKILSVTVRISAGNTEALRTAPFPVKDQLGGGGVSSCSLQWHDEGHHSLRVDQSVAKLRCQIFARVDKRRSSSDTAAAANAGVVTDRERAPVADAMAIVAAGAAGVAGGVEAGVTSSTEIVLASASLDLDAARDGYNYVQLFSAGRNNDDDEDDGDTFCDVSEERNKKTGDKREQMGCKLSKEARKKTVGEREAIGCNLLSEKRRKKSRDEQEEEEMGEGPRPMGQLVLKLGWAEVDRESGSEEVWGGHTMLLVVRGASGLAKPDDS